MIQELDLDALEHECKQAADAYDGECYQRDIIQLVGRIRELERAAEWRPIETAPKDGTVIDLWVGDHRRTSCFWGLPHHCCGEMGSYCDSEWHDLVDGWVDDMNEPLGEFASPTHWMPLPPTP